MTDHDNTKPVTGIIVASSLELCLRARANLEEDYELDQKDLDLVYFPDQAKGYHPHIAFLVDGWDEDKEMRDVMAPILSSTGVIKINMRVK